MKLLLDHIAIPDFAAGAMENWGLITYLMQSLLYNPEESSSSDKQWVTLVVAHELAHQVLKPLLRGSVNTLQGHRSWGLGVLTP